MDEAVTRVASAAGAPPRTAAAGTREPQAKSGKDAADGGQSLPPATEQPALDLEQIAESLNAAPAAIGRELRFEVDVYSGKSVIHVLDPETGELIRQIPPEKVSVFVRSEGSLGLRLLDEIV